MKQFFYCVCWIGDYYRQLSATISYQINAVGIIFKYCIKYERQCFTGISKQRGESSKYDAQRSIIDEIRGPFCALSRICLRFCLVSCKISQNVTISQLLA